MFSSITCFVDPSVSFKLDLEPKNTIIEKKSTEKTMPNPSKNKTKDKSGNIIMFKPGKK